MWNKPSRCARTLNIGNLPCDTLNVGKDCPGCPDMTILSAGAIINSADVN